MEPARVLTHNHSSILLLETTVSVLVLKWEKLTLFEKRKEGQGVWKVMRVKQKSKRESGRDRRAQIIF